jgi:hypothetical protein
MFKLVFDSLANLLVIWQACCLSPEKLDAFGELGDLYAV